MYITDKIRDSVVRLFTFWEVLSMRPKKVRASQAAAESKTKERVQHPSKVTTDWGHAERVATQLSKLKHKMLDYPMFRDRQPGSGKASLLCDFPPYAHGANPMHYICRIVQYYSVHHSTALVSGEA